MHLAEDSAGGIVALGDFSEAVLARGQPTEVSLRSQWPARHAFVARWEADGSLAWARTMTSPGGVEAAAIATAREGIYLAAYGGNHADADVTLQEDAPDPIVVPRSTFVARHDDHGALVWARPLMSAPLGYRRLYLVPHPDGDGVRAFGNGITTLFAGEPDETVIDGVAFVLDLDAEGAVRELRSLGPGDPSGMGETHGAPALALGDDGELAIAGTYCTQEPVWGAGPATIQPPAYCCEGDRCFHNPYPVEASLFAAVYAADGEVSWHAVAEVDDGTTRNLNVVRPSSIGARSGGVVVRGVLVGRMTFDRGGARETTLQGGDDFTDAFVARWDRLGRFLEARINPVVRSEALSREGARIELWSIRDEELPITFGCGDPMRVDVHCPGDHLARWSVDGTLEWVLALSRDGVEWGDFTPTSDGGVAMVGRTTAPHELAGDGWTLSLAANEGVLAKWRP